MVIGFYNFAIDASFVMTIEYRERKLERSASVDSSSSTMTASMTKCPSTVA